jgi:hypothetical protein
MARLLKKNRLPKEVNTMKKNNKKVFLVLLMLTLSFLNLSLVVGDAAPDISITLLNQDPDPVKRGDVVEVRFKIENIGSETLDNIFMEVLPKKPFTLYGGSPVKTIGKLRSSQTGADAAIVDFKLKVDEDAAAGENELEVKLTSGAIEYIYDSNEFLIDVEEYNLPGIKAYVRESSILQAGDRGKVVIEIANTDLGDAKFAQLTLEETEDYQILSSSNYIYLGDIDSDDTESEEFEIYVDPDVGNKLEIPVLIQYQDNNEVNHEMELVLELRIFNSGELKTLGFEGSSMVVPILLIILVVLAGLIYWHLRMRKKRFSK